MTTGLFTHPACLGHQPPLGYPESPDRLRAVLRGLEAEQFQYLLRSDARPAPREAVLRAHCAELVEQILDVLPQIAARQTYAQIDADTVMSAGSAEAALCAAGAVVDAVDAVMAGQLRNAFCAVRPPGHHAERRRAMGFCLFNNVAVGALHARAVHGCQRVAVVDFDAHHGNGTQDIAYADPDFFYASTHQFPFYPGSGAPEEHGVAGNIVNVPLLPGTKGGPFAAAFSARIMPALEAFAPDFLLISAGFDAHRADPLADLCLGTVDFAWATEQICALAARCCGGRVVSVLEGGYDLDALARSAAAHVAALMQAP